jgi:type II secretion system protein G
MLARLRKVREEKEGGFTLIELLVVTIIIGILAAIAIPTSLNQRQKGYDASAKSDLRNLANAQETYLTDNTAYTDTMANLAAFKKTTGVEVGVAVSGASSFCAVAKSQSGEHFWYDSLAGGVQAASTANLSAAPATAAGACVSAGLPTATA